MFKGTEEKVKTKLTIESVVYGNITAALRSKKIHQNNNKVLNIRI